MTSSRRGPRPAAGRPEAGPPVYRLLLEYDGTRFAGWQNQPGRPTVQAELEAALARLFGRRVATVGAARTDAGVHAAGQAASFRAPREFRGDLRAALNHHLPPDIVVLDARAASPGFHARRDALAKTYLYRLVNRPFRPALEARRAGWVAPRLDLAAMRREAARFLRRRDFAGYAGPASRGLSKLCRLKSLRVRRRGEIVEIELTADRFLHRMARRLAGELVQAGLGRVRVPQTAEPQGLILLKVIY